MNFYLNLKTSILKQSDIRAKKLYFNFFFIFSLPDKIIDNFVKIKMIKLGNFKENIIGFIDGRDASSKLTVMNIKTNQVCCSVFNFKKEYFFTNNYF